MVLFQFDFRKVSNYKSIGNYISFLFLVYNSTEKKMLSSCFNNLFVYYYYQNILYPVKFVFDVSVSYKKWNDSILVHTHIGKFYSRINFKQTFGKIENQNILIRRNGVKNKESLCIAAK